jgi:hypothetical protein
MPPATRGPDLDVLMRGMDSAWRQLQARPGVQAEEAFSTAHAQTETVRRAPSGFSFPQPSDMCLPRYPRAIAVCRPSDGAEFGRCIGPDLAGQCPVALAHGTVPCSGSVLSLPRPIRGSTEWHIPSGYRTCLLGSYEVFRQPVSVR